METQFEEFIPADNDFSSYVDAAYEKQYGIFRENIARMRQIEAARAEGNHVVPIDQRGNELVYRAPQDMEYMLDKIDHIWHDVRPSVVDAHSAQAQVEALFEALRRGFGSSCYMDNASMIPLFWHGLVQEVAEHYIPDASTGKTSMPAHEKTMRVDGGTPHAFFQTATEDMCAYGDLAVDALSDINRLTKYHEHMRGYVGDEVANTPYALTLRRYCAARKITDPDFTLSERDKSDFTVKMARFYVNELFAPFKDVMPKDVYPEMAWFIGAATDAIRFEDRLRHEKSLSVQDRILRQGRRMDWLPPANDEKPEAIAASATRLTRMRENLKNGMPVRSTTEILNDPAAVNRIKKCLARYLPSIREWAACWRHGRCQGRFHRYVPRP